MEPFTTAAQALPSSHYARVAGSVTGVAMARIVVLGGGVVGLCTAMLLAEDGHDITVLERDPAPPPESAEQAWDQWERSGVNQFRMLHLLLPRFRQELERELPHVARALSDGGMARYDAIDGIPESITGGRRADDDRFAILTARRPVAEALLARSAASTSGLTIRRGEAIRGVHVVASTDGIPDIGGVMLDGGEIVPADLVVDATGRRSRVGDWLTAVGARPPLEEREDCGFVYYGRYFRSADGSVPPQLGPLLQDYDSVSILTLPADRGTWGVGLITSAKDKALRNARHVEAWMQAVSAYPLTAHWVDAEPMTDVDVMAGIEDRFRSFVVDDAPVCTGLVPVGDAWACTNPSLGRGISIGMQQAVQLRDTLREEGLDRVEFARRYHERTTVTVEPLYRDTVAYDRHRLAEIDAEIAGVPYETDDPSWLLGRALKRSAAGDPELMRGYLEVVSVLARGVDVLARPGMADRAIELADPTPLPGPSRAELVALLGGLDDLVLEPTGGVSSTAPPTAGRTAGTT